MEELHRIITCLSLLVSVILLAVAYSKVVEKKQKPEMRARWQPNSTCDRMLENCKGRGIESSCCAGLKCNDNGKCVTE